MGSPIETAKQLHRMRQLQGDFTERYEALRQQGKSHAEATRILLPEVTRAVERHVGGDVGRQIVENLRRDPESLNFGAEVVEKWDARGKAGEAQQRSEDAFAGLDAPGTARQAQARSQTAGRAGGIAQQQQGDPMAALRAKPILETEEQLRSYQIDPEVGLQAQADPESIAAQRRALAEMEAMYRGGGYTQADRDNLLLSQREVDADIRRQREAALGAMQLRGLGGSGAELGAVLSGQQAGAEAKSAMSIQSNADASKRAMDAMQSSFDMAGTLQANNQAVDNYNQNLRRTAHVANQGLRHGWTHGNLGEQRAADAYNRELPWRTFGAQMQLQGARSNAAQGMAGFQQGLANTADQGIAAQQAEQERRRQERQAQQAGLYNTAIGAGLTAAGLFTGGATVPAGAAMMANGAQQSGLVDPWATEQKKRRGY